MFSRFKFIVAGVLVIYSISACGPAKKLQPVTVVAPAEPALVPAEIPVDKAVTDPFLEQLLAAEPQLADMLVHRKDRNTQIIFTQIDRGGNGMPVLTHHYFNVNSEKYFYPASVVKLPVSLLALQRLNELRDKGLDRNTTMISESANASQTAVYNDPTTADGRPTVAQYIRKIFMVSDNDAFNRLYEFLGQDYINRSLHQKGYKDVQLLHRLQISLTAAENRQTNPVKFISPGNTVLYEQPALTNSGKYAHRKDSLGKAYYQNGKLFNGPMDFSLKNRTSLQDLHSILISLIFPEQVPASQRFNISAADREFVLKCMSQYPAETESPAYLADSAKYWPANNKLLLWGSEKGPVPPAIRIFNKTGGAYGQLLDVAYIVDFEKGVEFFLSAVTYCNSDGVINDDKYDYNTIGIPFLKQLGQTIYNYEVKRPKKHLPDLTAFKFIYDK
jgi:beta-lactamase class A